MERPPGVPESFDVRTVVYLRSGANLRLPGAGRAGGGAGPVRGPVAPDLAGFPVGQRPSEHLGHDDLDDNRNGVDECVRDTHAGVIARLVVDVGEDRRLGLASGERAAVSSHDIRRRSCTPRTSRAAAEAVSTSPSTRTRHPALEVSAS